MLVGKRVARDDRVDLAGLEGDGARGGVGYDAVDDAVQKRPTLFKIIFVAHQRDMAAFLPFFKLERTAADGLVVIARIFEHVGAFVNMLGHDAAVVGGENLEKGRISFFENDPHRGRIRRFDRFDVAVRFAPARVVLTHQVFKAELHVGRSEGLTVVPFDVVAQLK